MSADRELLELAAKAGGLNIEWCGNRFVIETMFRGHLANYEDWNPLTDDGDALRLAVKLNIGVMSAMYTGRTCAWQYCKGKDGEVLLEHGDDAAAATRRAIVRVAADIGRSIP